MDSADGTGGPVDGSAEGEVRGGLDEPTGLEPEQGTLALARAEDTATQADWEAATAAVLRKTRRLGEDDPDALVWDRLTRTTLDGIGLPPIGTAAAVADLPATTTPAAPGVFPYTRGRLAERPETGWDVRPASGGTDPAALREELLAGLETGATSVWLRLGDGTTGLRPADLPAALEGVFLDLAPVVVEDPADPVGAARALTALLDDLAVTPAEGTNLGADPVGALVRGTAGAEAGAGTAAVVAEVAALAREAGTLALVVDGTALHDLGASDAQELGYALAVGAAYLRHLEAAGFGIDEALGLLEFRLAVTDEQFASIAKLRAARRAWARVADLSGAAPQAAGQRQHVVTSRPMMTRYDPWVNMLRTTVAAFAAGVGGADAVTVLPFDTPLGVPDAFGRRIARNTSSLLIHEAHVAAVADPAGGAYAVEQLTDDLAEAAWAELLRIEEAGGVEAALADGSLRGRVDAVVAERERQVARRQRPITGVSEFPHLGETLPERPAPAVVDPVRSYGASFEALRDTPPARPVFLATLGPVAQHTARATFATNLLAAGGVAVEAAGATADVDELVAAYRASSGSPVVLLAGTDPTYAERGTAAAAALREAGATWVVVAGKPLDGADDACALGVDALDFLNRTREKLA